MSEKLTLRQIGEQATDTVTDQGLETPEATPLSGTHIEVQQPPEVEEHIDVRLTA